MNLIAVGEVTTSALVEYRIGKQGNGSHREFPTPRQTVIQAPPVEADSLQAKEVAYEYNYTLSTPN